MVQENVAKFIGKNIQIHGWEVHVTQLSSALDEIPEKFWHWEKNMFEKNGVHMGAGLSTTHCVLVCPRLSEKNCSWIDGKVGLKNVGLCTLTCEYICVHIHINASLCVHVCGWVGKYTRIVFFLLI